MPPAVMIVEDNPITRKFVRVVLAAEGIDVLEAESGEVALAIARSQPLDLVLQDLTLDDIDGFQLVSRLRELAPGTPIVAFTGLNDEPRIRSAGFTGFVMKPVEPDRLTHAVRAHLGREASASSPSLPRTTTQERAWNVVRTTLSRLTEIVGRSESAEYTMNSVLESLLDASGFSMGFGCALDGAGAWQVCAQLGLGDQLARELAARWLRAHSSALALDEPIELSRTVEGALFGATAATAALLIPLCHGDRQVGVLALASRNELHPDWRQLARLLAGPLAQAVTLAQTAGRLVASETKFRGIADSTADGILLTDAGGEVKFANISAAAILGRTTRDLVGARVSRLIPRIADERWSGNITRGDDQVPVAISLRTFEDPPAHVNRVYVVRDLSESVRVEAFSRLANLDALTGICNRRRFDEELRSQLASARRYGTELAVLLVDLDRFKPINDAYGHPAGDAVLIAVARILQDRTRVSDTVARLGGDEFVALLDHTSPDGARTCAESLLAQISSLALPFEGASLTIGASIGIATFPLDGASPDELLGAADRALYRAKYAGRGKVMASEARRARGIPRGSTCGRPADRRDGLPEHTEPSPVVDERADGSGAPPHDVIHLEEPGNV
jgi:diguanylate cyclase (GGDEF)-like protein